MTGSAAFLCAAMILPPSSGLQERLVARAVAHLAAVYDLGTPRVMLISRVPDPNVLGRPDIALLVRRRGLAPVGEPNPDLMVLSGLLATGIGSAASPYELVGPDCGFGYTSGLSWIEGQMGRADPARPCPWGDWQERYPKDAELQPPAWSLERR